MTEKKCTRCAVTKSLSEFYPHSETRDGYEAKCRACRNEQTSVLNVMRGRARKRLLVEERGGKCEACGGSFHPAAFDFHHKDPTNKRFNISGGNLSNKSLRAIREETNKCALLCSNCHRELHAKEYEEQK